MFEQLDSVFARRCRIAAGLIVVTASLTACGGGGGDDDDDNGLAQADRDTVVARTNSSGPVATPVGGTETVGVTFATEEGEARNLRITNEPSTLPPGWNFDPDFNCGTVTQSQNSCQLNLTYAPRTAVNNNTLVLNYTYNTNITNEVKVGKLIINYSSGEPGTVVATAYLSNVNNISVGDTNNTNLVFSAIERPATNLRVTTDLASLPAGWLAENNSLTCNTVATTGRDCQLNLTYAPSTVTAETTLPIDYTYTDADGNIRSNTVTLPYSASNAGSGGNGNNGDNGGAGLTPGSSENGATPGANGSGMPTGSGDASPVGSGTDIPSGAGAATPTGLGTTTPTQTMARGVTALR